LEYGCRPVPPPDLDGTSRALRPPNGFASRHNGPAGAGRPSPAGSGAELAPARLQRL